MTRSVFTKQYDHFRLTLCRAREDAELSQKELAARLRRPQSYVSKYERGERRLDVVEFLEVAQALDIDAAPLIRELQRQMPRRKTR